MQSETSKQSWLVASEAEFRLRFWVLAALFFASFQLYRWDHAPAAAAMAGLLARLGGSLHGMESLIYAMGALLVVAAAGIRTWAAAYMNSSIVHDERVRDHRLVAEGPYRHLRNPLYLGTILVAVGIGLAASRTGFCVLTIAVIFFQYRLTRREESSLLLTQGESYRRYLSAVPRLLPSLRPKLPAGCTHPHWGQAYRGEIFMWLYAASYVGFAMTGSTRLLTYGCIAATATVPLAAWLRAREEARQLAR